MAEFTSWRNMRRAFHKIEWCRVFLMSAYPTADELLERLQKSAVTAISFRGVVFRSAAPKYADEKDLLSGGGARLFGARWNPIGIAAVYGAATPELAMAETLAMSRYYGLPIHQAMPRIFVAIDVRVSSIIDLTDGSLRQRLKVSESRMLKADWRKETSLGLVPLTHLIGKAVFDAGFEGLLVHSSTGVDGKNLVIFPENLRANSHLQVRRS